MGDPQGNTFTQHAKVLSSRGNMTCKAEEGSDGDFRIFFLVSRRDEDAKLREMTFGDGRVK